MKVDELPLAKEIIQILKEGGIEELYPPQEKALPYALNGKNLVLSIPTASGKSLVAYLAIINAVIKKRGKALYIVPLRALATEKWEDLLAFEKLGIKIGIATGDLDESGRHLARNDIIVCTSEKADSLFRHRAGWLDDLVVVVADEVHLINDASRGPTLEVIISRFKVLNRVQIIALSATIQNADELASWLDAELIKSNWRPVPLKKGLFRDNAIHFTDDSVKEIDIVKANESSKEKISSLVKDTVKEGGQALVFVNSRRSTVSLAKSIKIPIDDGLREIAADILNEPEKTIVGERLARCVENGVAFHHAGLNGRQRKLIERAFKEGKIKCIIATPTLAAGVNIPARRVIVRDLWRYDSNIGGMSPIPILEIRQMMGRAGRPKYDKEGEAVLLSKNGDEQIWDYLISDVEPIYSKLGTEPALRMHLLAIISTGFAMNEKGIYEFIKNTFYNYQSGQLLEDRIGEMLQFLERNGFIKKDGRKIEATTFGKKTSDFYIDPLSAMKLREALEKSRFIQANEFSYLHAISATPDMYPLYLKAGDEWVEEKAVKEKILLENDDEWFLSEVKTASLLEDWINEISENRMVKKYGVGPGDIHSKVESAEWLLHATRELARMFNFDEVSKLGKLVIRMRNGCKEELLNLIQLRGIGRIRARALYKAGFTTINRLRRVHEKEISKVPGIGKKIAKNIKEQLE